MSKRLIISVVFLGIFFAFGTVLADYPDDIQVKQFAPTAQQSEKEMAQPGTFLPEGQLSRTVLPDQMRATPVKNPPQSQSPDTTGCFWGDYWDPGTAFDFSWDLAGASLGEKIAIRFDIPANHTAENYGTMMWFWDVVDGDGLGVPDVEVIIHEDAAGLPGAAVYTEYYTLPVGAFGYYYLPFTPTLPEDTWVDGGNFHISMGCVGGDPLDEVLFDSDDGGYVPFGGLATGTGRGSYYDPTVPQWYDNMTWFGGALDPNWDIWGDYCYWYTNCYQIHTLAGGTGYVGLWIVPDPYWASGQIMTGFAQRCVSAGPDTLKSVSVRHIEPSWFFGPLAGYDATSTNSFVVEIWPDDGLGNIDYSAGIPMATRTTLGGLANMFPAGGNMGVTCWEAIEVDFSADNLVLLGPWHVAVSMSSSDELDGICLLPLNSYTNNPGMTGGSVNFIPPSLNWDRFSISPTWQNEVGYTDNAFYCRVNLCRDEFYECQWFACHLGSGLGGMGVPYVGASKVQGKPVNRLEEVWIYHIDPIAFGYTDGGNYAVQVKVWADGGGAPGAELWAGPVHWFGAPGTPYPHGWIGEVIPGGLQTFGDFYIGWENVGDPGSYFYWGAEFSPIAEILGGMQYYSPSSAMWKDVGVAIGQDCNLWAEAFFCSIPVEERSCDPRAGEGWTTVAHDYARTNASFNPVDDAWCDLTLNAQWEHPTWGVQRSGPVIYTIDDDPSGYVFPSILVQSFSSGTQAGYYIFDLTNIGAGPIDQITSTNYPQDVGGSVRCTPTIDIDPTYGPVLYIAGGTANAVSAYELMPLMVAGAPVLQIWNVNPFDTPPWEGHTGFMAGVRYGTFAIVNDGSTNVLYWQDDNATVYAADASTGLPYTGYTTFTPFNTGTPSYKSLTTDGIKLYVATTNPGAYGNVSAYDALTGAWVWDISGLHASDVYTGVTSEEFIGGCSYDAMTNQIYVNSYADGDYPTDGVFYIINAADGTVKFYSQSVAGRQNHPIIDGAYCYILGQPRWSGGAPLGGSVMSFSTANGSLQWAGTPPKFNDWEDWFLFEPVLSCEPFGKPDLIFGFNGGTTGDHGYLSCFEATTGVELFHRRVDHGTGFNTGAGGAIGPDADGDVHVVFADAWGTLYDLTKQDDRPRLALLAASGLQPVPFNTSYDTVIVFPDMYANTGCTDLIVSLKADEFSNGVTPPSPGFSMIYSPYAETMSDVADQMTDKFVSLQRTAPMDGEDALLERSYTRDITNRAASGVPVYLVDGGGGDCFYPAGGGFVTTPGSTSGIHVRVNGPLVNRGPQYFYAEFTHNDPDYFLNNNSLKPEIYLCLVGGCLADTTFLHFGMGGANHQIVTNSTRMGTGDWGANLDVDGFVEGNYQMFYGYGVTDRRIAINTQDWWTGGGETNSWESVQPDPNFCSGLCKPYLYTPEGSYPVTEYGVYNPGTHTVTYYPLLGNMVCKSWIDSVQNFDDGFGGWDWEMYKTAPFDDDSTMGLHGDTRTIGVLNDSVTPNGLLNQCHVEIMEVWERNGEAVPNWKMGGFDDCDVVVYTGGDFDTCEINRDWSAAWAYDGTAGNQGAMIGWIKLPFGCGETPIKNVVPIERAQSVTSTTDIYWDSLYFYFSRPEGQTYGHVMDGADDQDFLATFIEHDFAAYDTIEFAIATFQFINASDEINPTEVGDLAVLLNKMLGFSRGDVDNDGSIGLADIIWLADYLNIPGRPGPVPFEHLGDVDGDGIISSGDVDWLVNYYFGYFMGCPAGEFVL